MDGSQDSLDAFHARLGVLTWRSEVSVKDLLRETLRRSAAQRVTPANPNVIESMMYGCRVAEVTTFLLTPDTMQVLCGFANACKRSAPTSRRPTRSTWRLKSSASGWRPLLLPSPPRGRWPLTRSRRRCRRGRGRPLQVWPPPRSLHPLTAGPTSPRAQGRRRHPLLLSRPLGERQRRVTLYHPQPRQLGAQSPPRPLRGSCLEDRPTRCLRLGTRQSSRPGSSSSLAARRGGRWRGAGQRPSARAPTRTSV